MATLSYHPGPRYGVAVGAGAVLGGSANTGSSGDVGLGEIGTVSGSWLALLETARRPFVLATAALSVSTTTAVSDDGARHRLTAGDLRAGIAVGKSFGRVVPYAAARVFGGPVYWRLGGADVTGTDAYHYTIGVGARVRLPAHFDAFVEAMPIGAASFSLGVSAAL